jgi:hypothetical protein
MPDLKFAFCQPSAPLGLILAVVGSLVRGPGTGGADLLRHVPGQSLRLARHGVAHCAV